MQLDTIINGQTKICNWLASLQLSSSNSKTSILDLPREILEMIFKRFTATQDVGNCSIALVGTIHEEFVMERFLKPQLEIFASLDINLNKSLKKEGWFKECHDTKSIVRLWKKFKPSIPGITVKIFNHFYLYLE